MVSFSTVLLRLFMALLLGSLIGLEREYRHHTAGLRTNALVAVGTALFTIISAYGFEGLLGEQHISLDPTRVASYVVAGIGFLGGGAIYFQKDNHRVKGLTTAAAIWIVAAIGMACGAGLLLEAIATTLLALVILVGFRYLEIFFWPPHTSHTHLLRILLTSEAQGQLLAQIYEVCQHASVIVEQVELHGLGKNHNHEGEMWELVCYSYKQDSLIKAIEAIRVLIGVKSVQLEADEVP
jgi:putative Mg2+ transporter-C (MgtC) family protein